MTDHQMPPGSPESHGDGPFASHPILSEVPRDVRQQIAAKIEQNDGVGAAKILRGAVKLGWWRSNDIIGGIMNSAKPTGPSKLASGVVDKGGTTVTLFGDGTFTTRGFTTSQPDRLVAFSSDIDSMRRKSLTGRGAAAIVTTGLTGAPLSLIAGNNRGVIYVTITGERSGVKTYTTRNPEDKLLSSVRSLQAAADQLLASPPTRVSASDEGRATATTTQQQTDVAAQLKTLAELHASGALSDEEFATAKARLLS